MNGLIPLFFLFLFLKGYIEAMGDYILKHLNDVV